MIMGGSSVIAAGGSSLPQVEEESYNATGSPSDHPYFSVVVVVHVVTILTIAFVSPKLQLKSAESNAVDSLLKINNPANTKIVIIAYFIMVSTLRALCP